MKQYVTGRHLDYGEETDMHDIYGAEHLLRMLGASMMVLTLSVALELPIAVSLPHYIAGSTMDRESVQMLREYVNLLFQCVDLRSA